MNLRLPLAALAAAFTLLTAALHAQVPQLINYQGRVAVGAVNFNSPPNGQFKFALVNPTGTTTYWSNDNTSVGGSQPTAAVSLLVTKGLYSVLLGDTTLTGMPTAIPASVWTNADVRLRVWFNDGTNGFQLLTPDQRLAPTAYLSDNSVTSAKLADGSVASAKIAAGAVVSSNLAPNAVAASNLAPNAVASSNLLTGAAPASGQVLSFNGSGLNWITPTTGGGGTITLPYSQNGTSLGPLFSISNSSSGPGVQGSSTSGRGLFGTTSGTSGAGVWGETSTIGGTGIVGKATGAGNNGTGVFGGSDAGAGLYGSSVSGNGVFGTSSSGFAGYFSGNVGVSGVLTADSSIVGNSITNDGSGVAIHGYGYRVGTFGTASRGVVGESYNNTGVEGSSTVGRGVFGKTAVANGSIAGVWAENSAANGTALVGLATSATGSTGIYVKGSLQAGAFDGNVKVTDIGSAGNSGTAGTKSGKLSFGASTRQMLNLWGSDYQNLYAGTEYGIGVQNFALYFRSNSGAGFAWFQGGGHDDNKFNPGTRTGADSGTTLMTLDTLTAGVNGAAGSYGMLTVGALTIRGGSDLAEPFKMTRKDLPSGSVVVIDDQNPGHLKLSESAYDQRVAGIVSGANGIRPGIALQQDGALEGDQNVALSGRVYVHADASNGAIKPGDLLTTSEIPGHAMKATDHDRAQGAIIGKAMSGLKEGHGMVLVLVSLQ